MTEHLRTTPGSPAEESTDELVDRVLRSSTPLPRDPSWEDLRHHTDGILQPGTDRSADGIIWDDVVLAVTALKAAGEQAIPTDVAQRHLQAMHDALDAAAPASTRLAGRWSWRRRFASAAAAVTAFTTAGGGTAVAFAQDAAPGDTLYGVKRAAEQVQFALELDPQGDAELHVRFAERRLEEAQQAPGVADDLLEDALTHISQAGEHGDAATQQAAEAAGARAIEVLTELLGGKLPETASPRAREALRAALDRKQAHIDAREEGKTGEDQAPGQQTDDEEPGTNGRDRAPGQTGERGPSEAPGGTARPDQTGAPDEPGPPERAGGGSGTTGS